MTILGAILDFSVHHLPASSQTIYNRVHFETSNFTVGPSSQVFGPESHPTISFLGQYNLNDKFSSVSFFDVDDTIIGFQLMSDLLKFCVRSRAKMS